MKIKIVALIAFTAVLLSGCASFSTTQIDESDAKTGSRKITTKIKTRTFFDSKSELAKLKATTTDKSQSVGVGSLAQEASGTNVTRIIDAVTQAAVTAAAKAATGK